MQCRAPKTDNGYVGVVGVVMDADPAPDTGFVTMDADVGFAAMDADDIAGAKFDVAGIDSSDDDLEL